MVIRLLTVAAILLVSGAADAKDRVRYIYQVKDVAAASKVTAPLDQIRDGLTRGIGKTAAIASELPEAAPDPAKQPEAFKRYLKRKRLRAFRVNLEVTRYQRRVETIDERGNKAVTVSIELRLFGETVPDRVMAFAGDGSATVKIEVGKQVRPRDDLVANHDAIEVAIEQAIGESLRKLSSANNKKKKKRSRRKK